MIDRIGYIMYNKYDLLSHRFFYSSFLLRAISFTRIVSFAHRFFYTSFLLHDYNMNIKERTYNVMWLQMFLEDEQEEEEELDRLKET